MLNESIDDNAFGKLVRSFRKQRGLSQADLAEQWGHSREYVSLIERGARKLDRASQIARLAEILEIPPERLDAIGRGIASKSTAKSEKAANELLLQTLLEPSLAMVKFSWLIWHGDGGVVDTQGNLLNLVNKLDKVLETYNGEFAASALQIQVYAYEALGKLAMDRVRTKDAISYFQRMLVLSQRLNDPDLIALALIHQSEMLRRQSRYEMAVKSMKVAENYIQKHEKEISPYIQGMLWKAHAITYFTCGDEAGFLPAIDRATAISKTLVVPAGINNEFDEMEILQTKAQGYTMLWQPEKALEIYNITDDLRPARSSREQCSYYIVKAQAYSAVGDLKKGINYALKGLELAEVLQSTRYIVRLRQMSDRLHVLPLGREKALQTLRRDIYGILDK